MANPAKFRIDVTMNDLRMNSSVEPESPAKENGLKLPEPIFQRFLEKLNDYGPAQPRAQRKWMLDVAYCNALDLLGEFADEQFELNNDSASPEVWE